MLALSVGGAYAYFLCTGLQTYETRTWEPNIKIGEEIAIHVPTSKDWDDTFDAWGVSPSLCPKSAVIGEVTYAGCTWDGQFYRHYFDNPIFYPEPIRGVKGKRKYWDLLDSRTRSLADSPIKHDSPTDCAIFSAQADQIFDILNGKESIFFSQHELEHEREIALLYAAPYGQHEAQEAEAEAFYGRADIVGKAVVASGQAYGQWLPEDTLIAILEAFERQKQRLGWEVAHAYLLDEPRFFSEYLTVPGYGDPTLGDCWLPGTVEELKACKEMLGEV